MPRNIVPKNAMMEKASCSEPGKTAVYSHGGPMFPRNVILVGPRASGKTTLGGRLGELLGKNFVDLDDVITAEAGMCVPDIVAKGGWEDFRAREAEVVARLCSQENRIIATGGGAVLNEASRRAMRQGGMVFYLKAEAEVLLGRLSTDPNADQRPPLTDKSPADEMRAVLQEREPMYMDAAHHVLDASVSVRELTVKIMNTLQAWAAEQA